MDLEILGARIHTNRRARGQRLLCKIGLELGSLLKLFDATPIYTIAIFLSNRFNVTQGGST